MRSRPTFLYALTCSPGLLRMRAHLGQALRVALPPLYLPVSLSQDTGPWRRSRTPSRQNRQARVRKSAGITQPIYSCSQPLPRGGVGKDTPGVLGF
jgi:hypothetical protein